MFACIATRSQTPCTIVFQGRVTNAEGTPLFGASVLVTPGPIGQSTDGEGHFRLARLCHGDYHIRIQYVGHKEFSADIRLASDTVVTFTLEEDVKQLAEVVIDHHDVANTEHAVNFVELDERQLDESAGRSLGETLQRIPGVTSLQTGPGIFKPVIHGVHGQRLLLLNHGLRQEGQQWGAEHAPEIDPFIASNIVVIKDASAIKYGTDAIGGVIVVNPAPLPETNTIGGTVSSVLQSNGRSGTLSGMVEGGIRDHNGWGWRLQGTAKRTGDFSSPDYSLTNTGVSELGFSAAAGYHTRKLGLDIFFSRFQSDIGILRGTVTGNLDDLVSAMERPVPLYTSPFSYSIEEPRQSVNHNLLKFNGHLLDGNGEWRFQYGFQNNNRQEYDMRIGDLSKTPALDLQLNTHTIDVQWETHHSDSRTMSFGVNGMYQVNKNIPGTQRIPFVPNFNNLSAGVFAVSKFFMDKWIVDAGVRYDYRDYSVKGFDVSNTLYRSSFGFGNASASVGLTRELLPTKAVSLSVSTSWRPPHVSELFSLGRHQSVASDEYGLLLDPETSEVRSIDDMNVSPEQALKLVSTYRDSGGKVRFSISPYVNYIRNFIYLTPRGITKRVDGVSPYFWYDQTNALFLGLDADASVELGSYLTLVPKVSLLRARDVKNTTYFLFIPSNRYELTLRHDRPSFAGLSNAYIETGFRYVSRQMFAPRVITVREIKEAGEQGIDLFENDDSIFDFAAAPDGYGLLRAAIGFSVKSDKIQYDIRLTGENLLNQRYRDYANRFRYYADDLGRNLVLSLKIIF